MSLILNMRLVLLDKKFINIDFHGKKRPLIS
jgi:hypothetical protein